MEEAASAAIKPFVGRARDLAELRAGLDEAVAGNGSLVLVAGEPGIGKTRLAEQAVLEAADRGVVGLWSRAWEGGGAPAFWPWIQVLRQLFRQPWLTGAAPVGDELATALGGLGVSSERAGRMNGANGVSRVNGIIGASRTGDAGVGAAVRMVPELAERFPPPAELAALQPKELRFRLFDGVATLLARAGEIRPLLVVLDDLHWADGASLELLKFVARELHGVRLLLLGTYRDVPPAEAAPGDEVAAALGSSCQRMVLRGLAQDEVAELLALTTGTVPAAALAGEVLERTGGNPLFVREIARLLAAGVPGIAVPEGVRAVLGRRLGLLSPECAELLAVASVLGREPRLDLLLALAGLPEEAVLERLGEAVAARLMEEVPGARGTQARGPDRYQPGSGWPSGSPPTRQVVPSRWRFTHALVREVLYSGLSPARRLALHQRAGEAIEARFGGDLEGHLVELADHFLCAFLCAGPAAAAKAVHYATRAGTAALELAAWEEAAGHFQRALDTMELAPGVTASGPAGADLARRCELELALADARMAVGEVASARAGYERAATLARRLGDVEALARAAFGLGGEDIVFTVDEPQIALLEEVLGTLAGDSALKARVLARLARALVYTPALERRIELCDRAVAMARRVDDPATLAAVLCDCHTATWVRDTARRPLASGAREVIQLAEAAGDRVMALRGRFLLALDLMELGEVPALRAETDAYERGARALRQPHLLWPGLLLRATVAVIDGRFDEADRLLDESLDVGRRAGDPTAAVAHFGFRFIVNTVRGNLPDLEAVARQMLARRPVYVLRAVLALILADTGRVEAAREEFDRLAADRFASLPRDTNFFAALFMAGMIAYRLGDADRAAVLYALYQPYDGQVLRMSRAGGGCMWPISHHLGLLAAAMGRWDDALAHLDAAIELAERMGALPFLATTRWYRALALRDRGRPGDADRAARELEAARAQLRRLGVRPLFAPVALLDPDLDLDLGRETRGVLRREGEYWIAGWRGSSFRLRDTVGLAYLARLLGAPGTEVHALDLIAAAAGGLHLRQPPVDGIASPASTLGRRGVDEASAGPLLDEQVRRAYRERLRELEEELAEAEQWHDQDRATRARAERAALTGQLGAAIGFGGRARNAARGAERARVSVTKALRAAIRRIDEHDPALAEHLHRSVRTGSFCAYDPDPDRPVTWSLS